MNVLIVNTFDTKSGSAIAARRLNQGLHRLGETSQLLVQAKYSSDPLVLGPQSTLENATARVWRTLNNLPLKLDLKLRRQPLPAEFSVPWLSAGAAAKIAVINPDLINLHWINYNYFQIETITRLAKPIVWTLHDMWPFTGGCHYSEDCDHYIKACGACPQLSSHRDHDLSRWIWQRKANAWQNLSLTIVTPSKWLAACAARSSLFHHQRIEAIPNGLDMGLYRPIDRQMARQKLKLPQNKQLILFGAINATSSRRKGFHLLKPALQNLSAAGWSERTDLVIFGSAQSTGEPDLGFTTHYLGQLNDDSDLALAYAAADVFVAPSIQENLPNTLVESIACGTPGVAFNIGGVPDIIEHQQNGYLAQPYQTSDLAAGIAWILADQERYSRLCASARRKAEQEFSLETQAQRYRSLFYEVVAEGNHHLSK